mgnify:CR=1 FL=1
MNRNQVKGRIDETAGEVTETTGKLIGDEQLERKGAMRKWGGKIRARLGDLCNRVGKRGD